MLAVDRLYTNPVNSPSDANVMPALVCVVSRLRRTTTNSFRLSFSPLSLSLLPSTDDLEASKVAMDYRRMLLSLAVKRRFYQILLAIFLVWFSLYKLTHYGVLVRCDQIDPSQMKINFETHTVWLLSRPPGLHLSRIRLQSIYCLCASLRTTRKLHLPRSRHSRRLSSLLLPQSQRLSNLLFRPALRHLPALPFASGLSPRLFRRRTHWI